MIRFVQVLITGMLTSMFFFPFEFVAFPGVNTKMILAAVGLVLMVFSLLRQGELSIPKEILFLILLASSVSVMAYFSQTVNHTPDSTYVTYIISFAVWLSAAFTVCWSIKAVHGRIDVPLIVQYLAVVCVFQCAITMVIDYSPAVQNWVDAYVEQSQELLHEVNRLYGIGASLDVAGLRFSLVLVAISALLAEGELQSFWKYFYVFAFLVITVIGNMIARTVLVGTVIGIAWMFFSVFLPNKKVANVAPWLVSLFVVSGICFVLYQVNVEFRNLFRFAFEGFFSLVETGQWQTDSTDKLATMVVFPESIRTWIIGDGYFENSRNDINYLGDATEQGFYMGTDIGYLRFIFYFGVVGMLLMVALIVFSAVTCIRHFPKKYNMVFLLALATGLAVWFKVSTDAFLFFALFLAAYFLTDIDPGQEPSVEFTET